MFGVEDREVAVQVDIQLGAVGVHVGRLRRKVDEPFGTDHIATVRGVGYRMDGDGS